MPFFTEGQDPLNTAALPGGEPGRMPMGPPEPDPFAGPSAGETISAAFRLNNPVVSVLDAITRSRPDTQPVDGYNPMHEIVNSKYEPFASEFLTDRNPAQVASRKAKIDSEQHDRQTLAASGFAGTVASLVAGATDPSWFIPILGEIKAAGEGAGVLARAARGAAEGFGKSVVSEVGLQASQDTRTIGEGVADVATNTLLMGLIGGGAGWLAPAERDAAVAGLDATRADLSPMAGERPPAVPLDVEASPMALSSEPARAKIIEPPPEMPREPLPNQTWQLPHAKYLQEQMDGAIQQGATHLENLDVLEDIKAGRLPQEGGYEGAVMSQNIDERIVEERAAHERMGEIYLELRKIWLKTIHEDGGPPNVIRRGTNDNIVVPIETPPSPGGLSSDLSAASADRRDMRLSRIGLPMSVQDALRSVPGAGAALDFITAANMRLSPTLRVFSSASLVAKRAMGDMAETALRFTQSERGVPTAQGGVPLDRLLKIQEHELTLTNADILRDKFLAYRGAEPGALAMQKIALSDARNKPNAMSFAEFKSEVTLAGSNGDVHAVPQVAAAAREIRTKVLDPVTQLAQRVTGPDGKPMLAEALAPPKGDKSFFPRQWNKQALAARRNDARRIFADWLQSEQARKSSLRDRLLDLQRRHNALGEEQEDARALLRAKMEAEIKQWGGHTTDEAISALKSREKAEAGRAEGASPLKAADKAVDKAVAKIVANPLDLSREDLESRAAEIIDRINNAPDGRIPYDAASGGPQIGPPSDKQQVRGSLNARDFAIPTASVKDFIHTDAEHVISAHLRTALPDIHITDRFGDVEMQDVFRRLNEEYDTKAKTLTSEKALTALDNERKAMNRDLAATRDRLRHVYGWELAKTQPQAARIANAARNYNMLADLGTSVFNRLTDSVNAIYRHGFMNVMADGYLPFFKGLVGMEKDFAPAARASMHDLGVGVDSAIGHLSHQFGDVISNYLPQSKFERGLGWAADKSMILNLHGPWTDGIKTIAGTVSGANLLRTAEKVTLGTASEKEIAQLAQSGIEPFMAERIWNAFKGENGGQTFGGRTHVANTAEWTDGQARGVFASAVGRDADMSVLTPGLEKPLWMSGPVVSLLGQYKSFIAAAHEKLLISNLQQMDARTLQGLAASLGMGMLSYRAYTLLGGAQASDRPQDWIKEGISRSAILGWFSEINSMQAKFTGGKTDMFRLIGADHPLSRRSTNGALSEMLGPTYSKLEGIAGGLNDISHGTWTAQDTHKLRQAMILQNLFAVRRLFDAAEDGFNEHLGIKPLDRSGAPWPGAAQR